MPESKFIGFAESELARLENRCKDGGPKEMQQLVNKHILELVRVFNEQGHSGFSASYCLDLFLRLAKHKPATALTGDDDEWTDIGDGDQQNRRCPSVFRKTGNNSTAHDLDAACFSDNGGHTWFCNAELRKLYEPKIVFPYYPPAHPKHIYIKWIEDEPGEEPGRWVDITDNEAERKRLYDEFDRNMKKDGWK